MKGKPMKLLGIVPLYQFKVYLKCISYVIRLDCRRKYNYTYKTQQQKYIAMKQYVLMQVCFFYLLELESRISTF